MLIVRQDNVMSFRRDKEKTQRWESWLQKHHAELVGCGVPHLVLEDIRHWYYFLEHGYFTPTGNAEPIINVDRMSQADAMSLCLFLERDDLYPCSDALNRLQYLLKRGQHAQPTSA